MKGNEEDSKSCGNLGNMATYVFFDPVNLGLPIIYSFFTNQGYSRYLTQSGEYCLRYLLFRNGVTHYGPTNELADKFTGSFTFKYNQSPFRLADLGGFEGSRHYINATILETGQRLVFANKKYHVERNRVDVCMEGDKVFSSIEILPLLSFQVPS